MATMMRMWLLVWVISDMMMFKMSATLNSSQEINSNSNNMSEITTETSKVKDEDPDISDLDAILNILHPGEPSASDSDMKEEHKNKSSEQTEPTKQPNTQLTLENPDNVTEVHNERYISTTTPPSTTSNSTTETLIPAATVKSSIKHKKDSQQKIIIRYALC
jgi:hypothetical protein